MAQGQRWLGFGLLVLALTGCVTSSGPAAGTITAVPGTSPAASPPPTSTATPAPATSATPAPAATPSPAPVQTLGRTATDLQAVWDTKYLRVKLNWNGGCDAGSNCNYQIFRKEGSASAPAAGEAAHAKTKATEYYDNVQRGKFYTYWVGAEDSTGRVNGFSTTATVSVPD